jgi:hypothetical protein
LDDCYGDESDLAAPGNSTLIPWRDAAGLPVQNLCTTRFLSRDGTIIKVRHISDENLARLLKIQDPERALASPYKLTLYAPYDHVLVRLDGFPEIRSIFSTFGLYPGGMTNEYHEPDIVESIGRRLVVSLSERQALRVYKYIQDVRTCSRDNRGSLCRFSLLSRVCCITPLEQAA